MNSKVGPKLRSSSSCARPSIVTSVNYVGSVSLSASFPCQEETVLRGSDAFQQRSAPGQH